MINSIEDDRIEMAKAIAKVRKSGLTNMYDRKAVVELLYNMDEGYTANYLDENKDDYMNLLVLSGEY